MEEPGLTGGREDGLDGFFRDRGGLEVRQSRSRIGLDHRASDDHSAVAVQSELRQLGEVVLDRDVPAAGAHSEHYLVLPGRMGDRTLCWAGGAAAVVAAHPTASEAIRAADDKREQYDGHGKAATYPVIKHGNNLPSRSTPDFDSGGGAGRSCARVLGPRVPDREHGRTFFWRRYLLA